MVVTVAQYPMDVDLYQSQKALDNGKWALKEGGTIILVSKCRTGVGDEVFCQQLSLSKDPRQILKNLAKEYKLGYHKAAKVAEIMTWANDMRRDRPGPRLLIDRIEHDVRSATSSRRSTPRWSSNPDAKVLVIMDGSVAGPEAGAQ